MLFIEALSADWDVRFGAAYLDDIVTVGGGCFESVVGIMEADLADSRKLLHFLAKGDQFKNVGESLLQERRIEG